MCHIDHPEFPELNLIEFVRENIYQLSCSTSVGILVESNFTKNEIVRYNVDEKKIKKINLYYNKFENIKNPPAKKLRI